MNSNLPIKKENGIIFKIKNFFRKIFSKKENLDTIDNKVNKNIVNKTENNFENNLKIEVSNEYIKKLEKKDFIDKIEKNPDLLYDLSNDRLKKLEAYYDDLIEKDKEELKNAKKTA